MTKTLPLEEVKKLATPGPLEVRIGKAGHACLYLQGTMFDVAIGMKPANAALLAHSMNIRDDLIEALERVVVLGPSKEGLGGHAPISAFIDEAFRIRMLLERVKKVEMP